MRAIHVFTIALSCMLAGFTTGRLYRAHERSPDPALENYAITSILADLGYAHYLRSGDTKMAMALVDTSLHANLNRAREHAGSVSDPEFVEAKVRALQAVSLYWQANPPFTSNDYKPNETNSTWIEEWKQNQLQNFELLAWAQRECASHPEFKCKQR